MAVPNVLFIGGGDRTDGIYKPAHDLVNGMPAYDCAEMGSELMMDSTRQRWFVAVSGQVLHEASSAIDSLPETGWGGPTLTVLRPGACVSSAGAIAALGTVVGWRLEDAEWLSSERRPASAAEAYRSAHVLAATRCFTMNISRPDFPASLAIVDSGHSLMRLGQMLRAIPVSHPKYMGSSEAAIEALRTAEVLTRAWQPMDQQRLLFSQLVRGHTHMSLAGVGHARAAVRAFTSATSTDPHSAPAAASRGRALVLLARRYMPVGTVSSNHTLEAAVGSFTRLVTLLSEQRVSANARRDDVFGMAKAPLWWADAWCCLGEALQLLAAASQWRTLARRASEDQLSSVDKPRQQPSLQQPSLQRPAWAQPGWIGEGSAHLTRAARAVYRRGMLMNVGWESEWQRWNVEPPPLLHAGRRAVQVGSTPWLDPTSAAAYGVTYPTETVATLEGAWREIRDEILRWHTSLGSTADQERRRSQGAEGTGQGPGAGLERRSSQAAAFEGAASQAAAFEGASGLDDETLLFSGRWSLLRFLHPASVGWLNASVRAAPLTAAVLDRIPALSQCAREGCSDLTAQLSHLVAGSHIAPHCGRGRLTLMLPLIAPRGCCRLQVGPAAPREMVEGKVVIFDDSWEHQVSQSVSQSVSRSVGRSVSQSVSQSVVSKADSWQHQVSKSASKQVSTYPCMHPLTDWLT